MSFKRKLLIFCKISKPTHEMFEKLDESSKDILFKRFYESKTAKEIGQDNGYGRETARRRINEALEKLKQCLQN